MASPALTLANLRVLIQGKEKIEIIKTVSSKYKEIGDLFDFDKNGSKLDTIIMKSAGDPESCCRAIFQHWLYGNGMKPLSWATLLTVLERSGFSTLVEQIKEYLRQKYSECSKSEHHEEAVSAHVLIKDDSPPTLRQLVLLEIPGKKEGIRIIETVSSNWKEIGDLFDFDAKGSKLNNISGDPESCCRDMFQHWLNGNGVKPVSWATLLTVLGKSSFSTLVDQIKECACRSDKRSVSHKEAASVHTSLQTPDQSGQRSQLTAEKKAEQGSESFKIPGDEFSLNIPEKDDGWTLYHMNPASAKDAVDGCTGRPTFQIQVEVNNKSQMDHMSLQPRVTIEGVGPESYITIKRRPTRDRHSATLKDTASNTDEVAHTGAAASQSASDVTNHSPSPPPPQ